MEKSASGHENSVRSSHLLDQVRRQRVPVAELIGFSVTEAKDGRAVATLEATGKHTNPMGTLHGGILCGVADAATGTAFASTLAEGETFTTVELRINFFRPVWNAKLSAEAKVIQRGKTLGFVECDIRDDQDKLIAKASSTCLALDAAKGTGR